MLTNLVIRNFKRFDEVEIPLASPVVFVGPNNSGKTTALQALSLWELGLRRWKEKRSDRGTPEKRPGVAINRRDLLMVPAPAANLLWRDLHVRSVQRQNGQQRTQNIRIDVLVEGNTSGKNWRCGLEFDFANDESFFCRPLRLSEDRDAPRMEVPDEAHAVQVAFLPPMSGLTSNEPRLDTGAINVRLGEGRTAEVLRNLCYQLSAQEELKARWIALTQQIKALFNVELDDPVYVAERGELQMTYRERGIRLDLSSSGRGLQQTLMLLAYLALHPGAVLLLDEPDAHLEILRQRDIYQTLTSWARESGSQVIIASHSEVVLNEAANSGEDAIIAFLGKPHRLLAGRTSALRLALDAIRFDQYYLAEQKGWVLYLEGSTDLDILRAFARRLGHPAAQALDSPFFVDVGNQPDKGRRHFNALVEAKPDLRGFLLVDRDAPALQRREQLIERKWQRREIENYLCQPGTLEAYAASLGAQSADGPLFADSHRETAINCMRSAIEEHTPPVALRDPSYPFWSDVKASEEYLERVFGSFAASLGISLELRKSGYHKLVEHIPRELIDPEVISVLDDIAAVAMGPSPVGE